MDEWIMTQASFDRLWARVQGAEAAASSVPERDDAAVLRRFLDETAEALAFETRLARRSGGARGSLAALCRETRGRLGRLRAAYFLLTGERVCPPEVCPVCGDWLGDLRRAYLSARRRADAYRLAASESCPEELGALYAALAEEETAHAASLRGLIVSLLR